MSTIILTEILFGSHLYGLNTSQSDKDYKGVFLPSREQIFLGNIPKVLERSQSNSSKKNTKNDIDREIYSLHYFLKLACEGQTVALDMLHAPIPLESHPIWRDLVKHRTWFYTKNLKSFVGYARTQAAKYGIKGSRLATVQRVIDFLQQMPYARMRDIWSTIWEDEHCHIIDNGVHKIWQVCGKGISETASCQHAIDMLTHFLETYGQRARLAKENKGIDWKAISHALRAGYQALAIFTQGSFSYPLPQTDFLREVKLGKLDYITRVAPLLETLMETLEYQQKVSTLPDKVNKEKVNRWLIEKLEMYAL